MPRWTKRPDGSNWGDFGPDDQIGRMNLLTPERRLAGVAEVREGLAFSLSLPLDVPGGSAMVPFRKPPRLFTEEIDGRPVYNLGMGEQDVVCDDAVVLHTQYSTQWDSLAHWGQRFDADGDGVAEMVYYNGFRAGEHLLAPGDPGGPYAVRLGIENLATAGVQGRAVLVDLNAIHGTEPVRVGHDLLMQAMAAQDVEVRPGDFLLTYTGFDRVLLDMRGAPDRARLRRTAPALDGSDPRLLDWIARSGLVAICSDQPAVEVRERAESCHHSRSALPLHELCLFKLGIHLGELWYLEELALWLRARRRSAFLLTAPPLRLPGSVGSPVTPVATV